MKTVRALSISLLPATYAICRLPPGASVPGKPPQALFWSLTVTDEETSLVLPEEDVRPEWKSEGGWRCLQVRGPLPLDQTGILASIAAPLSDSGIPFFALSTFDTDYFLIKGGALSRTLKTLKKAGHEVR